MQPTIFRDKYGDLHFGWVLALIFSALIVAVSCIVLIGTHFSINNDRNRCHTYGLAANREVKFVRLTFGSDVCLTKNEQGQWIDINNIRAITTGGN